ncbi:MAG: thioredoxin domain-containing protein [Deltaproteobacteria bacterium]|nr:thioredoxin domain-containing protein [Deltaproteobacteria bacterium]
MLEQYPTQVKLVKKSFPLRMHRNARPAAIAALAAGEQGKFWEFNDKLFQNQRFLSDQKYLEIARELGLDMDAFRKSLKDPQLQAMIAKNIRDGADVGVTGTPTIFINGVRLRDRSIAGFRRVIDAQLKKKK